MIATGDRCADCRELLDVEAQTFRAPGGGLRCGRCDRKATNTATCARPDGCDVRTLCQTISCCAARNTRLVLELATRIAGPQPVALVAHVRTK